MCSTGDRRFFFRVDEDDSDVESPSSTSPGWSDTVGDGEGSLLACLNGIHRGLVDFPVVTPATMQEHKQMWVSDNNEKGVSQRSRKWRVRLGGSRPEKRREQEHETTLR